jgi:hypothetical protein
VTTGSVEETKPCPTCVNKGVTNPAIIAIHKTSCQVCNYERVRRSTNRRIIKDAVAKKDWTGLHKNNRDGTPKITIELLRPFSVAAKAQAAEMAEAVKELEKLGELSEDGLFQHQTMILEQLVIARCVILRRNLTERELWDLRGEVAALTAPDEDRLVSTAPSVSRAAEDAVPVETTNPTVNMSLSERMALIDGDLNG